MEESEPNLKFEQMPLAIKKILEKYKNKGSLYDKHFYAFNYLIKSNKDFDFDKFFSINTKRLSRSREEDIKEKAEEIITNCINYMVKQERGYETIKAYISSIKMLFEEKHINLEPITWKKIKGLQTEDQKIKIDEPAPKKQEMQKILSNMDALERAFVLVMLSSGLRPYDILYIELTDLHLERNPPEITNRVPCTKTKKRLPFTLISKEAKDAIETYLPQRQRYFDNKKIAVYKTNNNKNNRENKLFPIADKTMRERWKKKVTKVDGLYTINEKGEKKAIYDLYILRSYFRTYLGKQDLAEFLMGHTGMNTYYYRQQVDEAKKEYITLSNNLLINEESMIPEQVKKEYLEGYGKIKQNQMDELEKKLTKKMEKALEQRTEEMQEMMILMHKDDEEKEYHFIRLKTGKLIIMHADQNKGEIKKYKEDDKDNPKEIQNIFNKKRKQLTEFKNTFYPTMDTN
jgi:integrase